MLPGAPEACQMAHWQRIVPRMIVCCLNVLFIAVGRHKTASPPDCQTVHQKQGCNFRGNLQCKGLEFPGSEVRNPDCANPETGLFPWCDDARVPKPLALRLIRSKSLVGRSAVR